MKLALTIQLSKYQPVRNICPYSNNSFTLVFILHGKPTVNEIFKNHIAALPIMCTEQHADTRRPSRFDLALNINFDLAYKYLCAGIVACICIVFF